MMWFFAALIVVALGGIAALAAGNGTPMSPAFDDRPDATVPASGPLAGDDLRRVRFSLALRGYRMSEVDALLERLAGERDRAAAQQEAFARPAVVERVPGPVAGAGSREDGPAGDGPVVGVPVADGPVAGPPGVVPEPGPFAPPGPVLSDGGPTPS